MFITFHVYKNDIASQLIVVLIGMKLRVKILKKLMNFLHTQNNVIHTRHMQSSTLVFVYIIIMYIKKAMCTTALGNSSTNNIW